MTVQLETERCELGHEHITVERTICDFCQGVISLGHPKTVQLFNRLTSHIVEYKPLGDEIRQAILMTVISHLAGRKPIEFHFCCESHRLEFLRAAPANLLPGDEVLVQMTVQAMAQQPINIV